MEIGKIISKLRSSKGLSQRDFAVLMGVSNGAVGMWETNKRQPDLDTVLKIANYFKVSTDYLLGQKNSPLVDFDLSNEDIEFINSYKKLQPANQKRIEDYIKILNVYEHAN